MKKIKLKDIASIYNGNSINAKTKANKYTADISGWNYLGTKDIDFDGDVNYNTGVIIPFDELGFKIAPANSVFVCSEGGSAGKKTAYITRDVCFGNKLYAIVSDQNICNSKYIYYYTRYREFYEQFKLLMTGIIGGVSLKNFGEIEIPLAKIEEQRHIVSKIEELFSKLDEGIAELNRVKKQLEIYRQALLKEAFERCESTKVVNDVCIYVTDGDHMPPPKADRGIPFIMISNITNNVIDFTNTHFVKEEYYNNIGEKRTPRNGDVLYTVTGSYGIPVLINFDTKFCFQRHIALLRPNETIKQKFLYYAMQTPYVYKQATQKATGTAQKTVGLTVLRNIQIPYADLESQQYIVNNIEQKLSICDKVAQTVNESLQKAENLRQSILKQAFEGKLE